MSDFKRDVGRVIRVLASRGWADENAEIVAELLEDARNLGELVLADPAASAQAHEVARDLLERLRADTFGAS